MICSVLPEPSGVLSRRRIQCLAVFACTGLLAVPALAQDRQGDAAPPSASASPKAGAGQKKQPPNVIITSDARLGRFAEVILDVQKVDRRYRQRINTAADPQQKQALLEEANKAMIEIIEARGFTQKAYMRLSQAVRSDPEVQKRFEKIVQERERARKKAKAARKNGAKKGALTEPGQREKAGSPRKRNGRQKRSPRAR